MIQSSNRHRLSPLPRLACLVLILAGTLALAQDAAHPDAGAGIQFPVPAGWVLNQTEGEDGELIFELTGDGGGNLVVVQTLVPPAARPALLDLGPAAVMDAWEGFAQEVPGARIERLGQHTVAGRVAGRVDYVGDGVRGALLSLVGSDAVYTIVSIATDAQFAATDAALLELLDGFELLAPTAANPLAAAAPTNPLGSAAPANPLASAPGTNPLGDADRANPLAGTATPGRYLETFRGTDPDVVFGGVLDVGRSGAWTGNLDGAGYVLRNDEDGNAVRYYFAMTLPGVPNPLSLAGAAIDVQLTPGSPFAAAGLLFDFDRDTGHYLAFTVTQDGYAVLQNAGSGLALLANKPAEAVVAGAVNRLELRPEADSVAMFVNGQRVITLESGTAFAGGIGIVAIGSGTFAFRDLEVVAP